MEFDAKKQERDSEVSRRRTVQDKNDIYANQAAY
jgi:hypothetical protein